MDILLFITLITAILFLILIRKQQHSSRSNINRRYYRKGGHREYLEKVKEATKKRFEEERKNQEYKNNIKNDYL